MGPQPLGNVRQKLISQSAGGGEKGEERKGEGHEWGSENASQVHIMSKSKIPPSPPHTHIFTAGWV